MKPEAVAEREVGQENAGHRAPALETRTKGLTVAVLVDSIAASYGGPAYSVRRLWQSAQTLGAHVTVHSTDSFRVHESAEDRALWQPLDYKRWPAIGIRALGYARGMTEGVRGALAEDSSVISQHGLWLHYGRVAKQLGTNAKVPVIIHPHGMLEPWALRRSSWKKRVTGRLWEYENLRRAHCLRVTSAAELKSVRDFGLKNPVALIPNGVDVEDYAHLPQRAEAEKLLPALRDKRVLLFLSRVHPKKGLPLLLRAWKELTGERRDWLLAIAGPDQLGHTEELKQITVELGLQNSVVFTGALFGEEKRAAYALSDLFVLPSHSENFGVAVAEGLAAGLPVLTTKGTPWQALTEKNCGWWVDSTVEALSDALREALALSSKELKEMGAQGALWMKRDFSWEQLAAEMIRVCEWTLSPGGTPPDSVTLR